MRKLVWMPLLKIILIFLILFVTSMASAKVGDDLRKALEPSSGAYLALGRNYQAFKDLIPMIKNPYQEQIVMDFLQEERYEKNHASVELSGLIEQIQSEDQLKIFKNLKEIALIHNNLEDYMELINMMYLNLQWAILAGEPGFDKTILKVSEIMVGRTKGNRDVYFYTEMELMSLIKAGSIASTAKNQVEDIQAFQWGTEARFRLLIIASTLRTQDELERFSDHISEINTMLASKTPHYFKMRRIYSKISKMEEEFSRSKTALGQDPVFEFCNGTLMNLSLKVRHNELARHQEG